jgi:hypothetical protein
MAGLVEENNTIVTIVFSSFLNVQTLRQPWIACRKSSSRH